MVRRCQARMALLVTAMMLAGCACKPGPLSKKSEANADPPTVSMIDGHKLALDNHGGMCRVTSAAGPIELAIPWPCDFHRRADGAVRTLRRGQSLIALVQTSRPHPAIAGSCKTQIQALGIAGGKVYVSENTDTVAQCLPFLWDEQMFKGLFGDKEPGATASR
ncbi:MAG: hypothetical protein H7Y20_03340 [Bryobacteraceae bacterium]|nr:hypothetical protein [Bryobacteraceae bacterium]